MKKSTRT